MSIKSQYNETVKVERLAVVSGTNKKTFTDHISSLACVIQPLEPSISADIAGGFGKNFLMFCDVVDIAEGDRVIRNAGTANEKEYRVVGVESFDLRTNKHLEVTIRIFER